MTTHIDIDHIAKLARLELSPQERERYMHEIERVLAYMEKINAVAIPSGLTPMTHAHTEFSFPAEALQEDQPVTPFSYEQFQACTHKQREGCLVVPGIIEPGEA